MSDSVIKAQGLAKVLEELPEDQAIGVVIMFALGSEEEKKQLADAFEQQELVRALGQRLCEIGEK